MLVPLLSWMIITAPGCVKGISPPFSAKHYVINTLRPDRDTLMSMNDLATPLKSIDSAAMWAVQS